MDDAHRHLQLLMQRARKEIRRTGKVPDCFRRTNPPLAGAPCLRLKLRRAAGDKHADVRKFGRSLFLLKIATSRNGHGHVRLAGGKPHLPHQHALDQENVFAGHLQPPGHGGIIDGVQPHAPAAVFASGGALGLAGKFHGHLFARLGGAPHRRHSTPLQHHVIRKRRCQRHLRLRRPRAQTQQTNPLFHVISQTSIPAPRPALRDIS